MTTQKRAVQMVESQEWHVNEEHVLERRSSGRFWIRDQMPDLEGLKNLRAAINEAIRFVDDSEFDPT